MEKGLFYIRCEITSGKYEDQLLRLEDNLESGLYCELTDKTLHNSHIEYILLYDMIANRITIDEVKKEKFTVQRNVQREIFSLYISYKFVFHQHPEKLQLKFQSVNCIGDIRGLLFLLDDIWWIMQNTIWSWSNSKLFVKSELQNHFHPSRYGRNKKIIESVLKIFSQELLHHFYCSFII